MKGLIFFVILVVIGVAWGLVLEIRRHRALRRFWDRPNMLIRWRRRFPGASEAELHEFLAILVQAFCFNPKRWTCFGPEDRIMDVYRAACPPGSLGDDMELECLTLELEKRYGIGLTAIWHPEITLGEVYEHIRQDGV